MKKPLIRVKRIAVLGNLTEREVVFAAAQGMLKGDPGQETVPLGWLEKLRRELNEKPEPTPQGGLVRRAQVEVRRCQRNIDAGGSLDFWDHRLRAFERELEEALIIVQKQRRAIADRRTF